LRIHHGFGYGYPGGVLVGSNPGGGYPGGGYPSGVEVIVGVGVKVPIAVGAGVGDIVATFVGVGSNVDPNL
jgi:hypothetical protein